MLRVRVKKGQIDGAGATSSSGVGTLRLQSFIHQYVLTPDYETMEVSKDVASKVNPGELYKVLILANGLEALVRRILPKYVDHVLELNEKRDDIPVWLTKTNSKARTLLSDAVCNDYTSFLAKTSIPFGWFPRQRGNEIVHSVGKGAGPTLIKTVPLQGKSIISNYTAFLKKKPSGGYRLLHSVSPELKTMHSAINAVLHKIGESKDKNFFAKENVAYIPGVNFVNAIRNRHFTQKYMASYDLKNYYHQLNGERLNTTLEAVVISRGASLSEEAIDTVVLGAVKKLEHLYGKLLAAIESPEKYISLVESALTVAWKLLDVRAVVRGERPEVYNKKYIKHILNVTAEGQKDIEVDLDAEVLKKELAAVEILTELVDFINDQILPPAKSRMFTQARDAALIPLFSPHRPLATIDDDDDFVDVKAVKGMLAEIGKGEVTIGNILTEEIFVKPSFFTRKYLTTPEARIRIRRIVETPATNVLIDLLGQYVKTRIPNNYEHFGTTKITMAESAEFVLRNYAEEGQEDELMTIVQNMQFPTTLENLMTQTRKSKLKLKRPIGVHAVFLIQEIELLSEDEPDAGNTITYSYGLPQGAVTSSTLASIFGTRIAHELRQASTQLDSSVVQNVEFVVYSDNIFILYDVPTTANKVVIENGIPVTKHGEKEATELIDAMAYGVSNKLGVAINPHKTTHQSGDDKKILGLLLDRRGRVRVPRSRVYEINQIALALHRSGGRPINYKGFTYSDKDVARLKGLIAWIRNVGREGYSQTVLVKADSMLSKVSIDQF